VRPVAVTLAAAVLVLSACGSKSRLESRTAPRLPREVAAKLADRSDVLAAALRRNDGCEARIQLHGLERQTRLVIASGRVPAVYRSRLVAAVDDLARRMPACVRPAPPPVVQPEKPERGQDKKKHDKHDKGKKKHGKGEGEGE